MASQGFTANSPTALQNQLDTAPAGSPIKNVSTKAWTKAKQRAGITNYRFHDNRYTWASWLRQRGVRLEDLQELGGWQSEAMVRRYAHIEADMHLRHATAKLDGILDGK